MGSAGRPHNGLDPNSSLNPVLERSQSQWIFTTDELLRSPSILEGMSVAQESANRQKGVNFITQVGIMLKLPQLTLATASVYLHRFFMRHSMALPNKPGLHHYSVAATALFLATKVEENCRKMRELIVACCRVAQKQPNLVVDEQSKEYWKWRDTILHNEDLLLEALCFDLQLEQPYKILFDFLCYYGVQDDKTLRNASWAFLNDSHITTLCLTQSARQIAGCALYAGVRIARATLSDDDSGQPWWQNLGLDIFEIQSAANQMAEMYQNPTIPRKGQKDAYLREDDIGIFDKTRHSFTPKGDRSPTGSVLSGGQSLKRERDDGDEMEWGSEPPASKSLPPGVERMPSPKRQRHDSYENGSGKWQNSAPKKPENPVQPPSRVPGQVVDDVQQRIDEIINASTSTQPANPSLSRRPSNVQSWQPGQPSRRPSSPSTHWQRPPSSASNGSHNERMLLPQRQLSYEKASQQPQAIQPVTQLREAEEVDDAEKVDYGSEEGEL